MTTNEQCTVPQKIGSYRENSNKGAVLEAFIHATLKRCGIPLKEHRIWEAGLDGQSEDENIALEALNWYGGYIHPERLNSIISNLATLGKDAKHKLFVCAGVKPTTAQRTLLKALGVKPILLPSTANIDQWKKQFLKALLAEGVITVSTYSSIILNNYSFLPYVVCISNYMEASNPHLELAFWFVDKLTKKKTAQDS